MTPFGFANAFSLFQYFINNTQCFYLNVFYTAYINNILIYSNNLTEHKKHVDFILKALRRVSL